MTAPRGAQHVASRAICTSRVSGALCSNIAPRTRASRQVASRYDCNPLHMRLLCQCAHLKPCVSQVSANHADACPRACAMCGGDSHTCTAAAHKLRRENEYASNKFTSSLSVCAVSFLVIIVSIVSGRENPPGRDANCVRFVCL